MRATLLSIDTLEQGVSLMPKQPLDDVYAGHKAITIPPINDPSPALYWLILHLIFIHRL